MASIDLPVEAFLPQVGVQASLLFLQKKTHKEKFIKDECYNIFMGLVDHLGKDRRGNPIYIKDDDGVDVIFDEKVLYLVANHYGKNEVKVRSEKAKKLKDELPSIVTEYLKFKSV